MQRIEAYTRSLEEQLVKSQRGRQGTVEQLQQPAETK